MKQVIRLIVFISFLGFYSCATQYSKVLKSKDNEYKLKMANEYYKAKQYSHAEELYQDLFAYLRGKPHYEDAFYNFCYCAFNLKDYEAAGLAFQQFTENFPNSDRVPECAYMQGFCLYKSSPKAELDQSATQKAIATLQIFLNTYPNDSHVAEVKKLIDECKAKLEEKEYLSAQLYYDLGYYKAAHIYFDMLMSDYPQSARGEEYMFKTVLSTFMYAKSSYDYLQIDRYQSAMDECDNFTAQYPKSVYTARVVAMRKFADSEETRLKNIQTKLQNIQNEQIKKAG